MKDYMRLILENPEADARKLLLEALTESAERLSPAVSGERNNLMFAVVVMEQMLEQLKAGVLEPWEIKLCEMMKSEFGSVLITTRLPK